MNGYFHLDVYVHTYCLTIRGHNENKSSILSSSLKSYHTSLKSISKNQHLLELIKGQNSFLLQNTGLSIQSYAINISRANGKGKDHLEYFRTGNICSFRCRISRKSKKQRVMMIYFTRHFSSSPHVYF